MHLVKERFLSANSFDLLSSWPFILVICFFSVIGAGFWLPLFDLDEGAFAEATREMLESGNWVSTYLNGVPRHDKPIMIYWLQAISVSLFGNEPWAYRLPSMISAGVWIFVVYRFVSEFYSESTAKKAVWMLAVSLVASGIFKAATADALLNCMICLIAFDIYRYVKSPKSWRLALLGFYMGLGFLTKGPVALIIPLVASLIAVVIWKNVDIWWKAVCHPFSWGTFLIVILPWHIASFIDQGWGFFQGFYLGHNLGRFNDTLHSHGGSPFYYLIVLPVLLLPFTRYFFVMVLKLRKDKPDFLTTYLWIWFSLTFLIFTFSQTQLPHYLLYGLTPIFVLIASRMSLSNSSDEYNVGEFYGKTKVDIHWLDFTLAFIWVGLLCLLPFSFEYFVSSISREYDRAVFELIVENFNGQMYSAILLSIFALSILMLFIHVKREIKLLCLATLSMFALNIVWAPLIAAGQQTPIKNAATYIKKSVPPDTPVVAFNISMPSLSVYLDKIVPRQEPRSGDVVYTKVGEEKKLKEIYPNLSLLFSQGGIRLYSVGVSHEHSQTAVD